MVAEYDLQVCSDLERCKVMREIELVENVRVVSVREEFSLPNKISFLLRLPWHICRKFYSKFSLQDLC